MPGRAVVGDHALGSVGADDHTRNIAEAAEPHAPGFAVDLHGAPVDLADALAKLGTENLSNLHPHPLYAAFYYSHPPLAERIGFLRALANARGSRCGRRDLDARDARGRHENRHCGRPLSCE